MQIPEPATTNNSDGAQLNSAIPVEAQFISERRYGVSIPDNDINDSLIEIRASVLSDLRERLNKEKLADNSWVYELLLAVSGIGWGSWISYLQSNGTYTDTQRFVFGTLAFGVALASLIAYLLLRATSHSRKSDNITEMLKVVPDPQKAVKKETP